MGSSDKCPSCGKCSWRKVKKGRRRFKVCRVCGHVKQE